MVNIEGRSLKRPTLVCDTEDYIVIKIGEYEEMKQYYNEARKAYSKIDKEKLNTIFRYLGLPNLDKPLERSLELIELPNNQEVVEKVFYSSGYLEKFIGKQADNVIRVNFEPII